MGAEGGRQRGGRGEHPCGGRTHLAPAAGRVNSGARARAAHACGHAGPTHALQKAVLLLVHLVARLHEVDGRLLAGGHDQQVGRGGGGGEDAGQLVKHALGRGCVCVCGEGEGRGGGECCARRWIVPGACKGCACSGCASTIAHAWREAVTGRASTRREARSVGGEANSQQMVYSMPQDVVDVLGAAEMVVVRHAIVQRRARGCCCEGLDALAICLQRMGVNGMIVTNAGAINVLYRRAQLPMRLADGKAPASDLRASRAGGSLRARGAPCMRCMLRSPGCRCNVLGQCARHDTSRSCFGCMAAAVARLGTV